ncbi:MAG: hypothetical protein DME18_08955 [Verrucomicrobia bacterium]|nr:MAG: hypothetical protein DME18_08955 [Verrucomicrobiota bacterium]
MANRMDKKADTGDLTRTVCRPLPTLLLLMLLLSSRKGLTNLSRLPEDLSDNGGNTLFFEHRGPKARKHDCVGQ